MDASKLTNFEKEYFIEASEMKVTIDDLKRYGVNDRTLSAELYLISRFGNEIIEHKLDDEIDDTAVAEVSSLDDYDIESSMVFAEIIKRIDSSAFDDNIDTAIGGMEI